MSRRHIRGVRGFRFGGLYGLVAVVAAAGCEDRVIQGAAPAPGSVGVVDAGIGGDGGAAAAQELRRLELTDSDFIEGDANRDPFRSFAKVFAVEATQSRRAQVPVKLDRYSLEDLRLAGIVSGGTEPAQAMLIDPTGVGVSVRRGDWVGRAEPTGTEERVLYWRVSQIRPTSCGGSPPVCQDGSVVFARQDPSGRLAVEAAPRVLSLHPAGEQEIRRR
jgi:type IV pilus assembly protein PilP